MVMELWTAATPNGWKVNIMVEELIELGIEVSEFKVRSINLQKGEQFSKEFTKHNLNQKIPVLIDGETSVMESCAILQYLGEKYPSTLLPSGSKRWEALQWRRRKVAAADSEDSDPSSSTRRWWRVTG